MTKSRWWETGTRRDLLPSRLQIMLRFCHIRLPLSIPTHMQAMWSKYSDCLSLICGEIRPRSCLPGKASAFWDALIPRYRRPMSMIWSKDCAVSTYLCQAAAIHLIPEQFNSLIMKSPNGNIFRVPVPLWRESTSHRGIPSQKPVTWSVYFKFSAKPPLNLQPPLNFNSGLAKLGLTTLAIHSTGWHSR